MVILRYNHLYALIWTYKIQPQNDAIASKVTYRMDDLIAALNDKADKKEHPVKTAAFLHHKLVEIHPFTDGNGRVARLLTNLYLMKSTYCSKERSARKILSVSSQCRRRNSRTFC